MAREQEDGYGEEEEEGDEEEEEEGEMEGEMEKVVVVKNSPSNFSALSYEMFVEGAGRGGAGGDLRDNNRELASLAGSGSRAPSRLSSRPDEEEERTSEHTNSSAGPRKVSPSGAPRPP